ncbi:ComEC/Rec2 family competence protein [Solirubrobacter deserti]|uniref:ComEC/Rec2 family competence protein n=1 Tax=Solirubrobacter deserti TaxID=2282478 RepID=A0ABT4RSB1_9ACTN|nr:ComEC/Rec2 family competence protein [Solirubrobacter deserti]MDA0141477.1 ComEC/Rec2 family competence protein [Solirubrobacter deserti]
MLAALVAGLLLGRANALAVLVAAFVLATLASRPWPAALAAAAVLGGATCADVRLAALDAGVLADLHGRSVQTRAVVLEPVRDRLRGPSVARVRLIDGPGAGEQAVLRSRAWPRANTSAPGGAVGVPSSVAVGDIVAVQGRVAPLGFADAYQRPRNAHAAIDAARISATGDRRGGLAGALDSVRRRADAGLEAGLDAPEGALLRGMVLGEDERLSEQVKDDFQASGLAHILAVSGQNVILLAALVLAAGALFGLPIRARLLVAAALIALYVPLTGAGPSIQRAGVMGIAGLVAALAGRPSQRWYALLLAAATTLALNPRAPEEPGWQLSFAAVAALLAGAKPLRDAFAHRMPGPVADVAAITTAATLGTAPLMALHFEQVSLAALPANLLAAPAIAPVMWLGVLASTAAQVAPALAAPFTALTAPLLVYIQRVAQYTADTPVSVVDVKAHPLTILAASVLLATAVTVAVRRYGHPRRRPRPLRTTLALGLTTATVVAATAAAQRGLAPPPPSVLRISFLDIGQGDATLIELDGTTVLVDTGKPESPILERLRQAGVDQLDALMLTHAENDHEGAAPAVIAEHRPRLIVDGAAGWESPVQRALAATRARIHAPAQGETITLGRLTFHVLWPPRRAPGWRAAGNPNDQALVMRLEAEQISVLLTADAESHVLLPLRPEPVDVLKVSHHGSADPGLPRLLTQLKPAFAAIEVGKENTYGHPAPSTLEALNAAVPTVTRTDEQGTVVIHADDGRVTYG